MTRPYGLPSHNSSLRSFKPVKKGVLVSRGAIQRVTPQSTNTIFRRGVREKDALSVFGDGKMVGKVDWNAIKLVQMGDESALVVPRK